MSKKRLPEQDSDRGEKMIKRDGKEPGRYDEKGPAGKSTARDATGVNPKEPIDPNSPTLIPE